MRPHPSRAFTNARQRDLRIESLRGMIERRARLSGRRFGIASSADVK
jgi:hypothetical protein